MGTSKRFWTVKCTLSGVVNEIHTLWLGGVWGESMQNCLAVCFFSFVCCPSIISVHKSLWTWVITCVHMCVCLGEPRAVNEVINEDGSL